ncbi:STAS domain-containing protein [Termitidicoccus mucosus]|uniref:STAS domain-containing protein n=1 Tax=Termitidicoccus mucosus TaxID=1184151 RepID=UPI0031837F05
MSAIKPVFLVDAYSDPVIIRIEGRASFQNSGCVRDFFEQRINEGHARFVVDFQRCDSMDSTFLGVLAGINEGHARFVVDFQRCDSMDSTFLGVLAGAGLRLRRLNPPGSLVLARIAPRNLELIRNLGLHHLATVDAGDFQMGFGQPAQPLTEPARSALTDARLALEAHENLVMTDEANREKFQDVLAFLKNKVGRK